MRFSQQKKDALEKLQKFIIDIHTYVDIIIVEGNRDVYSLRSLGCIAEIEVLNHTNVSDYDLAEKIASKYKTILILTDFDEEGLNLNQRFSSIFERTGVKIETGFRFRFARLMAKMGVYTIESLDNILI